MVDDHKAADVSVRQRGAHGRKAASRIEGSIDSRATVAIREDPAAETFDRTVDLGKLRAAGLEGLVRQGVGRGQEPDPGAGDRAIRRLVDHANLDPGGDPTAPRSARLVTLASHAKRHNGEVAYHRNNETRPGHSRITAGAQHS